MKGLSKLAKQNWIRWIELFHSNIEQLCNCIIASSVELIGLCFAVANWSVKREKRKERESRKLNWISSGWPWHILKTPTAPMDVIHIPTRTPNSILMNHFCYKQCSAKRSKCSIKYLLLYLVGISSMEYENGGKKQPKHNRTWMVTRMCCATF